MAHRLATEYVKTCLQLSEAELLKLSQLFSEQQTVSHTKVYENGNHEVVLQDLETEEEIVLSFEYKQGRFVSNCKCRMNNTKLANLMRRAISIFKGDAVVNRIYSNYTIVYYYAKGLVVKIVEVSDNYDKVIYEQKD